LQVNVACDL